MITQINCIMLVDDNKIDNFFHERVIRKNNAAKTILTKESGFDAIEYLKKGKDVVQPDVIFLDINMPGMNGWEFIEHYKSLDENLQNSMIVVMLSTSDNPDDRALAKTHQILSDFKTKPLTKEMLDEVLLKYSLNRVI
ncbi:chemotaxis protein CheY [Flavobacterium rivuli WB 3.3-2 = DSM 21788]|uniref:Chemotaxis protein CheY n=1 Tax=Flavobacterium rivuli WB 3.3-2 = DSM 21788 TaxID=1121895 RepID=A0A0A2MHN0_9FLAO|nr:response regulator [Flavobacterium rivuli]KGO87810.1 chemotaxis protein CheY [Flavobacterium rivuli WB 3.3-2 = DSM 21788]